MTDFNRQTSTPVPWQRTRRQWPTPVLTSMPAGKCVPLFAVPLLREESAIGVVTVGTEMLETHELLVNSTKLRLTPYFVPMLALERFQGSRDILDRSFMGEPPMTGEAVIRYIENDPFGAFAANEVYHYLGLHGEAAEETNTAYLEAYNLIWNHRAANRSKDLTPRARLETTLAPAFQNQSRFDFIVPDFDDAMMEGEVRLGVVSTGVTLSGEPGLTGDPALTGVPGITDSGNSFRLGRDAAKSGPLGWSQSNGSSGAAWTANASGNSADLRYERGLAGTIGTMAATKGTLAATLGTLAAELEAEGVSLSLANLALAKKTQAMARVRQKFDGIDEEWVIDMLMSGHTIPDQFLKNPVALGPSVVVDFGQAKRYATDSENLAKSAVSGFAGADVRIRVPRQSTGGVVMLIAEAVPDRLFERQRDPFFVLKEVGYRDELPDALRDYLDPQKVDAVTNGEIDSHHGTPNGTFGYEPLNGKWTRNGPRVGGKFKRPNSGTANAQERQRLWASDAADPVLGEDWYIVTDIGTDPFLDTETDPFEVNVLGGFVIEGNTQFGPALIEASDNYEKVLEKAPEDRIEPA